MIRREGADDAALDWARVERVLGRRGPAGGGAPLLLLTAGVHGNEPGGVHAALRVIRTIDARRTPLRGRLAAFLGNRGGLARDRRFVDEDLNRMWSAERLAAARAPRAAGDSSEAAEQRELLAEIERELAERPGRVLHLDLHSTSAAGPPFAVLAERGQSRDAALALGVPVLVGLEDLVVGTLIEWSAAQGHPAFVLEGGLAHARTTVELHESAIWTALVAIGVVAAADVPDLELHRARLAAAVAGLPAELEIAYRHALTPGEEFRMRPGYANFSAVQAGELLAHAGPGLAREVRAPWAGSLVMPRYQGQGQDGFFLGRPAPGERGGGTIRPSG